MNGFRFLIVAALDVASHYFPRLVPLYARAFHWSEDKAGGVET